MASGCDILLLTFAFKTHFRYICSSTAGFLCHFAESFHFLDQPARYWCPNLPEGWEENHTSQTHNLSSHHQVRVKICSRVKWLLQGTQTGALNQQCSITYSRDHRLISDLGRYPEEHRLRLVEFAIFAPFVHTNLRISVVTEAQLSDLLQQTTAPLPSFNCKNVESVFRVCDLRESRWNKGYVTS